MLYAKNRAKVNDKNSELFLGWLKVMQEWNYDNYSAAVSEATRRSVVSMVLHAIFRGISSQMAKTAEEISAATSSTSDSTEFSSDIVAMHRLCGWALFSTIDYLKRQTKKNPAHTEELVIAKGLKLSDKDKHLLPSPVKYLDRGGMTFMRKEMWPWMQEIEKKMAQHHNQTSYRQYGSRLFEVRSYIATLHIIMSTAAYFL